MFNLHVSRIYEQSPEKDVAGIRRKMALQQIFASSPMDKTM